MRIRRAIKDTVILELQNIVGALFSSGKESGTGMSTCHQDLSDRPGVSNNNLSKMDSRSACDLRDHTDFSPYMVTGVNELQQQISEFLTVRIQSQPELQRQESAHKLSMDTSPPFAKTAMPETYQKLLSNGLAAQCTYCKAINHFWKSCPKLKKKREKEDKRCKKNPASDIPCMPNLQ